MIPSRFKRPSTQQSQREHKVCKIKTRRDKHGRVIETSSENCSPAEMKALMGKNSEDSEDESD